MSDLENEIKEAIEKNLPAQVGAVLQERLAKAEEIEKENEKLLQLNETQRQKLSEHESINDKLYKIRVKTESLELEKQKHHEREQKLEMTILQEQLESAKREKENIYRFVNKTLATDYVKETQKQVPIVCKDYDGREQVLVEHCTDTESVTHK